MVEYSKVNAKLTNTQLKKLKMAVENKIETTLRMSLKMLDENNLPNELILTIRQKTKLRNASDIKFLKAQIFKIIPSGVVLGSLLNKLADPLMKVAVPLGKNILTPLGITAAASASDAGIQNKIHCSGATILIFSNEEMNDIIKII